MEYQSNPGYSNEDLLVAENLNGISNNNVSYIIGNNEGTDTESQLDIQINQNNLERKHQKIYLKKERKKVLVLKERKVSLKKMI